MKCHSKWISFSFSRDFMLFQPHTHSIGTSSHTHIHTTTKCFKMKPLFRPLARSYILQLFIRDRSKARADGMSYSKKFGAFYSEHKLNYGRANGRNHTVLLSMAIKTYIIVCKCTIEFLDEQLEKYNNKYRKSADFFHEIICVWEFRIEM